MVSDTKKIIPPNSWSDHCLKWEMSSSVNVTSLRPRGTWASSKQAVEQWRKGAQDTAVVMSVESCLLCSDYGIMSLYHVLFWFSMTLLSFSYVLSSGSLCLYCSQQSWLNSERLWLPTSKAWTLRRWLATMLQPQLSYQPMPQLQPQLKCFLFGEHAWPTKFPHLESDIPGSDIPEVWRPSLLFLATTQGFAPSAVLQPGAMLG